MKHGFLILLHHHYEQVSRLIALLDHEDSCIFLHVDGKSSLTEADIARLTHAARRAQVIFVDRVPVQWGGYSLVQATLNLFKCAAAYDLDYYHLISGADMPLRSWQEFNAVFESGGGAQFVSYVPAAYQKSLQKRVRFYWLFQEKIGNPKQALQQKALDRIFLLALQRLFVFAQKIAGVDRRKGYAHVTFTVGSNWVSITKAFLHDIVRSEAWVQKTFQNTLCPDEVFITTLLTNSEFSQNVRPNLRQIDWGRGNPYTFRAADYDALMNSGALFARKFDETVDPQIIDRIFTTLSRRNRDASADEQPEQGGTADTGRHSCC